MAPVDFEKELQDRLRSREVQPREDSWERIEARLEAEIPTRKPGSRKWKFLVAASVVFLLGYFLLQESALEVPATDAVVESPDADVPEILNELEKRPDFKVPESHTPARVAPTGPAEVTEANKEVSESPVTPMSGIVKLDPVNQADLADHSLNVLYADVQEALKPADRALIAASHDEENNEDSADAEVDALLSQALRVAENKSVATDTVILNPARLLGEVESELDQSFRDQILKKLKTGYNKVRTAVADRSH
ncbi:MAG: hypothetical protein WBM56_02910 [Robiginitalea sp.]|uniref:hypothetical protein n=1 Tax=Robiginitalea sp. TaxID=1902411 RepID=UPI003C77FF04